MAQRLNEAYQGPYPFFPKGSQVEAAKGYLDKRYGLTTSPGAPATEVPGPTPPSKTATPSAPGVPKIGTIEGGYRFKGGNPADPKNWEKVK